jgi:hypothetical protein
MTALSIAGATLLTSAIFEDMAITTNLETGTKTIALIESALEKNEERLIMKRSEVALLIVVQVVQTFLGAMTIALLPLLTMASIQTDILPKAQTFH